jgi:hypothetical protein
MQRLKTKQADLRRLHRPLACLFHLLMFPLQEYFKAVSAWVCPLTLAAWP